MSNDIKLRIAMKCINILYYAIINKNVNSSLFLFKRKGQE